MKEENREAKLQLSLRLQHLNPMEEAKREAKQSLKLKNRMRKNLSIK